MEPIRHSKQSKEDFKYMLYDVLNGKNEGIKYKTKCFLLGDYLNNK